MPLPNRSVSVICEDGLLIYRKFSDEDEIPDEYDMVRLVDVKRIDHHIRNKERDDKIAWIIDIYFRDGSECSWSIRSSYPFYESVAETLKKAMGWGVKNQTRADLLFGGNR